MTGSINELELDRWNSISGKMLSLNKCRINKGVGRSGIHKGLKDCVRKSIRGQGKSGESGFERADVLRVMIFA